MIMCEISAFIQGAQFHVNFDIFQLLVIGVYMHTVFFYAGACAVISNRTFY